MPALLLAAGESARMLAPTPKQLLPFHDTPLLHHAIATALAADLSPIIVVLGAHADRIVPTLAAFPIHIALNPHWQTGMGSSLKAGLAKALELVPDAAALLLLLADQPLLQPADFRDLLHLHHTSHKPLVASAYNDTLGVPALIARCHFESFAALPDHAGAKSLFARFPDDLAALPLPHAAVDIDTPADYASLLIPPLT